MVFATLTLLGGCTREASRTGEGVPKVTLNQRPAPPELAKKEAPAASAPPLTPAPAAMPDLSPILDATPPAPAVRASSELPAPTHTLPPSQWETSKEVRVSHAFAGRLFVAEVTFGGALETTIREVRSKKAPPLLKRTARVDAINHSKDGLCFVEFPNDSKDGIHLMTASADGTRVGSLLAGFDGGHRVVNCEGAPFWIAPVTEQGRRGGLAWIDPASGKRTGLHPELGPAFALTSNEGRVYFMAHQRGGPDVIYSMATDGTDLRGHVKMPRGVLGVAVGSGFIYWSHLMSDGRSTDFGRVAIDGSAPPEALATIKDHVFQSIALANDGLIAATSPAELPGHVVKISADQRAPQAWPSLPRVWQVVGDEGGVFLHYERSEQGAPVRSFARLDEPSPSSSRAR